MKDYHDLIKNKSKLKDFIDNVLPELGENEVFYLCLFARKKYGAKRDVQLKRITVSSKDWIIPKIHQMECPKGGYIDSEGNNIKNKTIALYINPNPRCLKKANFKLMKLLLENIERSIFKNTNTCSYTAIQTSTAKRDDKFLHFDIDVNEKQGFDIDEKIYKFVNSDCCHIIETRGGYHLLIKVSDIEPQYKPTFYMNIHNSPEIDVCGDQLLPIPGCRQGDFW